MNLYVQLGRAGDILNILPLLWDDYRKASEKPGLMVAAEFAPLLEGVSYVEPVIWKGPHFEIAKAVAHAKTLCPNVVCTQVNGPIDEILENEELKKKLETNIKAFYREDAAEMIAEGILEMIK